MKKLPPTTTAHVVASKIIAAAQTADEIWPDQLTITCQQRNDIGVAFHMLVLAGILKRTGAWRASKAEDANGRTIFAYTLSDPIKADVWVSKHRSTQPAQLEMF